MSLPLINCNDTGVVAWDLVIVGAGEQLTLLVDRFLGSQPVKKEINFICRMAWHRHSQNISRPVS